MSSIPEWQRTLLRLLSSYSSKALLPSKGELIHSIATCKEPHLPKRIYRYRTISGLELDNLQGGTVWLSSPDLYNDPYDCSAKISEETLSAILSHLQDLFGSSSPETNSKLKQIVRQGLDSTRKQLRICSLCEDYKSLLMWAHYAHEHKGFCVEYDVGSLPPLHPFRTRLYPVVYGNIRYDLTDYIRRQLYPHLPKQPLAPIISALQKSPEWSYEREWRLIDSAKINTQGHPFAAPAVKNLFLGTRTAAADAKKLVAVAQILGAQVHQMRLVSDSFCLDSFPVANPHPGSSMQVS